MGAFLMVMTQTLMQLTTPQRLDAKQQGSSHPSALLGARAGTLNPGGSFNTIHNTDIQV